MTTDGPYVTIVADPPWAYTQPLKMADGVKRSSASQYPTLSVQQVCDLATGGAGVARRPLTIAGHAVADTAFLWLWVTAPMLLEGVHARVCAAWGFAPKQIVPWVKGRLEADAPELLPDGVASRARLIIQPGLGALTRGCVEYLIVATRGKYTPLVKSHSEHGLIVAEEDAVILAPKGQHSAKPAAAYTLIERLCPGPRIELFARAYREGWDAWGAELPAAPPSAETEVIEWP